MKHTSIDTFDITTDTGRIDHDDDVVDSRLCPDCGITFGISAGETRWYAARGWVPPKRCPSCRQARRSAVQSSGGGR